MAFCTNCGGRIGDDARFCPACGQAAPGNSGGAANAGFAGSYPPPAPLQPLDYTVHGDNLQVARVRLKAGQELFAEAGKMLYKTPSIQWETKMQGEGIGQKIWGALKRKLMGESLFMTYFRALSDGEVGFAGSYPGRIQPFDLAAGQSVLVQRDGFLFAQSSATLNIAFVKKLGAGFFGGDFIEFNLSPGESLQVDTGCIVAFDETVNYDIQFVGGIKTAIFGGEGLFLATLTGPGRVIVQSMTLAKLRRELAPAAGQGGDERSPLGTFTNIFGSED